MPIPQVAAVANYDFGAPAVAAEVLTLRVKKSGKVDLKFINAEGDGDGTVTVKVSPDNTTKAAVTAANNLSTFADVAVIPKCTKEVTLLMRATKDSYLHVIAEGGVRMQMQVRGDAEFERILD